MWRPAIASLRAIQPGHTTLALDMPGEGESVGTFRGLDAAIEQLQVAIAAAGIETRSSSVTRGPRSGRCSTP